MKKVNLLLRADPETVRNNLPLPIFNWLLWCSSLALIQCVRVVGSEGRQLWLVPRHRVKENRCVEFGIMVFAILGMFWVSVGSIQLLTVFTGMLAVLRDILAHSLVAFGCQMVHVCCCMTTTTSQINTIIICMCC